MSSEHLLRIAIRAARTGKTQQAHDLFLRVAAEDRDSDTAWAWLIELAPELEERIRACEEFLRLNPGNPAVRQRLNQLLAEERQQQRHTQAWADQQASQAADLMDQGRTERGGQLLREVVRLYPDHLRSWQLLSRLSEHPEERIEVLQNLRRLDPENTQIQEELELLEHFRDDPFDLAAMYEERGEFEKAIQTYRRASSQATSNQEWTTIFESIRRLELRKDSGVPHLSPMIQIARMAFAPALLYMLVALIHGGLNPFRVSWAIWAALLPVVLGGLMIAVAEVRTRSRVWARVFGETGGGGSQLARFTVSLTGWLAIGLPFALLLRLSLDRLRALDLQVIFEMLP